MCTLPLLLQKGCCQHTAFEPASLLWSQQPEQQPEECQLQCLQESGQQLKGCDLLNLYSQKLRNAKIKVTEEQGKLSHARTRAHTHTHTDMLQK
jgi:hypothetical protein